MYGGSSRPGWASDPPALDCLTEGHMLVSNKEVGAFSTYGGEVPEASWCLWCGGGVSNELLPEE